MTLTQDQFNELKARVLYLGEQAAFFAPAYAQPDVNAALLDVLELLGTVAEETAMQRARSAQIGLFEGWPV